MKCPSCGSNSAYTSKTYNIIKGDDDADAVHIPVERACGECGHTWTKVETMHIPQGEEEKRR
jgi:transcriptional regulator NrdR family protein